MTGKRSDHITWGECFMGVALLSRRRSKDPSTQVGVCIVSQDNKILLTGYNKFPRGCSGDEFPRGKGVEQEDLYNSKYFHSTHNGLNTILNYRGGSLERNKLYVTLSPCDEYARVIIRAGTKTIVSREDKYVDTPAVRAPRRMPNAAGVRYYQHQPTDRKIEIEVQPYEDIAGGCQR